RELERGATSLLVSAEPDDLGRVLEGVLHDVAEVHLEPGADFTRAADLLVEVWERFGADPVTVGGGIGADPLGTLASECRLPQGLPEALAELGALAARLAGSHPNVRTVRVDTTPYAEAGAGETQELAAMLATGAAYLRAMADAGLDADTACR